ncbi:MAG: SWIM zinc finger family protein [Cyanobacteria bacterium P01_D01_bin.6]
MSIPNLTLATLQRHATDNSYQRGQAYFRSGAVVALTQRQQTLQAEVEGNDPTLYRVAITFDGGGITGASCTCPYDYEGWCKHIVATLLTCVHQPETIEQRPTLSQLLDQLNLVQTQGLVQNLIDENPGLLESVDRYVNRLAQPESSATKASSSKRKTSVDPAPFKRRAKEILRSAVRDWEYGRDDDDIAFDMGDLMETALDFLEQGDAPNAMVALQGITEGCLENWDEIDNFCGLTPQDVDLDFDAAWAEVILNAELTEDETLEWQERFEIWQGQLTSFAMSLEALHQGWDYPPLIKVFRGERSEQGAWSGEAPDWAGEFSQIRLKILARQERYEDYLHLAKAKGQTQAYMTMLGQLGRLEQVMTVAQNQMTTLAEAKALAELLRSQGQLPQAL